MRIIHVSSFAPPHLGGLETCAEGLFRQLAESGLQIQWLFSDVPHLKPDANTVRIGVWNGVEKRFGIPIPIPKPNGIRTIWRCVREADLVHVHDVMYFTSFWSVFFARVLKKRVVVTLHIWKVPYKNLLTRGLQALAHCSLGQFCLKSASAVVTYNRRIFDMALEHLDERRVYFVPNGISRSFLEPGFEVSAQSRAEFRAKLGLASHVTVALFAGRFVEKKGLSRIHSMAKRFPDVLFLFCGIGPDDPRQWNCANVKVLGQKTAAQLRELFYAADILLLPSVGEGFPLVIQEAMSCGLPCLVLEETWASWGRDRDLFIIATQENADAALGSYLGNPFPMAFRRQIQSFANSNWNWRESAAKYRKIYELLLEGPLTGRVSYPIQADE